MNKQQRREIFLRFQTQNPHPVTELVYDSPFELLIAVILSAQATDVGVNKATVKLFQVANTPQGILDLGLEKLKEYIKSIGLYNSKAQNIMKTCELLIKNHHGKVPDQREALEALPGVGRKTANVVLNTAFGQPTVAVDTHIFRVANRTGIAKGKTPLAVEKNLIKNTAPEFLKNAHHWLVLHGRYVCTARKPHCKTCVIQDLCEYPDKNLS
ncbi:endonuclease III [Legionella gratiana]|uniref:Endonuclease III n=1 Tax=Legionella gratiana TaxID=45066 RepID=A0A378J038_9GAMM|nr:endonuclease III [Legionella gratiana]KTD11618.1 endonuclease III [Legionella gratiana]STX41072.1 endonuclease III [Legionella gratiana]